MRKTVKQVVYAMVIAGMLAPFAFAEDVPQPYKGLQTRDIKALSPKRIGDLLDGQGLSYALAAELNGLPGPRHVLDLADEIALSKAQRMKIRAIFVDMQATARAIGAKIVAHERALDTAFAKRDISPEHLSDLTHRIAVLDGRLRANHLSAHLQTDPILTAHQKRIYANVRGYMDSGTTDSAHDKVGNHHGNN